MQTANDDLRLLRALCQADDVAILQRACHVLQNYPWSDQEYRVIFESCARLARLNAPITPGLLIAQLTREGFPDVDLDALFEPLPSAASELAGRLDTFEGKTR